MKLKHDDLVGIFVTLALLTLLLFSQKREVIEKIDVHEHIKDTKQAERLLPVMDKFNIKRMVLLGTPTITFGEETTDFRGTDTHMEELLKIKKKYPGKFLIFYAPNPNDSLSPKKVEANILKGIDGLKFYHGVIKGLGQINSSIMYEIYEEADKARMIVVIHVEALNRTQFAEFSHVLNDFQGVKFICPHFCGVQTRLDVLAAMLEKYPNLYTDMAPWHRVGKLAVNNSQKFRNFVIKYQNRIMFSSDIVLTDEWDSISKVEEWFRCNVDLLERSTFKCYREGNRNLNGLNLPKDVLIKIYQENPKELFFDHNLWE